MKSLYTNRKTRDKALVFVLFGLLAANTSLLDFSRFTPQAKGDRVQTVHFASSATQTHLVEQLNKALRPGEETNPTIDIQGSRVGDLDFRTQLKIVKRQGIDPKTTIAEITAGSAPESEITYVETTVEAGCSASRCLSRSNSIRVDTAQSIPDLAAVILKSLKDDAQALAKDSEQQKKEEERKKKLAELRKELRDKQERCELSSSAEVDEEKERLKSGKWEPGERLECRKDYIATLDRKDAEDYFHSHLKGDLSELLMSDDAEERKMGHLLMRDLSRSSQLRRISSLQFSFQNMRQAAMWNQQIGPLQRMAANGNQGAQMHLEMIHNQIRAQYSMSTQGLRQQLMWMDPSSPHYERAAFMLSDLEYWENHFAANHFPALGSRQDLLGGLGFQGDSLHSIIMNPALPERMDLSGRVARVDNRNLGIMNQNSQWNGLRRYTPPSHFNQPGQQPYMSGQVPPDGFSGRTGYGPGTGGPQPGQRTMPARFSQR